MRKILFICIVSLVLTNTSVFAEEHRIDVKIEDNSFSLSNLDKNDVGTGMYGIFEQGTGKGTKFTGFDTIRRYAKPVVLVCERNMARGGDKYNCYIDRDVKAVKKAIKGNYNLDQDHPLSLRSQ